MIFCGHYRFTFNHCDAIIPHQPFFASENYQDKHSIMWYKICSNARHATYVQCTHVDTVSYTVTTGDRIKKTCCQKPTSYTQKYNDVVCCFLLSESLVKFVSRERSVPERAAECADEVQTALHRRSSSIYQPLQQPVSQHTHNMSNAPVPSNCCHSHTQQAPVCTVSGQNCVTCMTRASGPLLTRVITCDLQCCTTSHTLTAHQHRLSSATTESTHRQSSRHSRSLKVTNFSTNRKPVCGFLLVNNTNLHPILHHF